MNREELLKKIQDGSYEAGLAECASNAEYRRLSYNLRDQFKNDLIDSFDLSNHPKAEKAFELAWDYGHSAGYEEVVHYFADVAELLR